MKITSAKLPSTVICPTSKSYANRALILSSLCTKNISLFDVPNANDVKDMQLVLKAIGIQFSEDGDELIISNSFPACEPRTTEVIELNLGEGGTTSRFLFPLLCLGHNCYAVTLEGEMASRPMDDLISYLTKLGAKISKIGYGKYHLQGPINLDGKLNVNCAKTTQFASALMHLQINSALEVNPINVNSSSKYLDMTNDLLSIFDQEASYQIPADYSSAGYFIAYAVLNQDLVIKNISEIDLSQADSQIVTILRDVGATIDFSTQGMKITKINEFTQGMKVDGSTCLDLVPTLMFLASFIPFDSSILNIKNLRFKECDRLAEMLRILAHFSISYSYNEELDILNIFPCRPQIKNRSFTTLNDHRMVMVLSLFLKQLGGGDASPEASVSKSFPDFFNFF
jgi:3-phosphoshikimate 1-carboxyvinyltransferase